jgi:hypothetical protein
MSSATIHSAISQPHPALKQYHQLVHGLNSLLVWFQRRVWSADGAVCDDITPCPTGSKNGWIGGGCFHLLQAPFGAAVAKKHSPYAPSWSGVAAGAAQVPNWLLPLQKWRRCQYISLDERALSPRFRLQRCFTTICLWCMKTPIWLNLSR